MSDNSLYCKVCQIHLTGPVPAMQHYSSAKHIKKVQLQSSLPGGFSGTSFVGVAGAAITSSYPPQGLSSTGDVHVDGIAGSYHTSSHQTSINDVVVIPPRDPSLPALQVPVVALPTKEFELDRVKGTGKCYLCGVDFSSVENADQHLAGQKHVKARLKWLSKQPRQLNKPYAICNPYLDISNRNNCEIFGQPASGASRTSATAATERLDSSSCDDSEDRLGRPVPLLSNPAYQRTALTDGAGEVEDKLRALSLSDPVPGTSLPVNSGCASGADCAFGLSGSVSAVLERKRLCDVCNKTVDTEEMLRLHCQSPAHLKKASRLLSTPGSQVTSSPSMSDSSPNFNISSITSSPGNQTTDNTLWFTCDVCNVRVNSADQLENHKRGAAHRKKLNASSGTNGDNTRWHSCTVCGKKLNSVPQLEVHMRSHGTGVNLLSSFMSSINLSAPAPNVLLAAALRDEEAVRSAEQIISIPVPTSGSVPIDVSCCNNQVKALIYRRPELDSLTDQEKQSAVVSYSLPVVGTSSWTQQPTSSNVVENKSELPSSEHSAAGVAVELDDDECFVTPCPDDFPGCISHCILCEVHRNCLDDMHVGGEKHAKKLKEKRHRLANPMNPCGPQFKYYCEICMVPFNTIKDQQQHERGQQHTAATLRCTPAPSRSLPLVKVSACSDETDVKADDGWVLTTSRPRKYQLELYEKALSADSVCFLPTGTGKTMVAIMVISRMLSLNPQHSAIFIVDKVLLALQQITVIRRELGDKKFKRWNFDTSLLEERPLRIAMLCGQREELKGSKIWDQDIIVVTAAYYVNLVRCGAVKWAFNCIAVFDEVHHCHSDHPYHELIQLVKNERSPIESRPKLLGLTASPASRESVSSTASTIRELLTNFCDSRIIAVEQNVEELNQFQSDARLEIREVSYTTDEAKLKRELAKYFESCVSKLENLCSMELLSSLEQAESHTAAPCDDCHLNIDAVRELLETIDEFIKSSSETVQVGVLIAHLKVIGQALLAVESTGVESAYRELDILQNKGAGFKYFASFDDVEQIGVSCPSLKKMISHFFDSQSESSGQSEPDANQKAKDINRESPIFTCLLKELVNWRDSQSRDDANVSMHMALVLVRQRMDAVCLASLLSETPEMTSRHVRVGHVVGHGHGAADNGMPVSRQSRVLGKISKRHYDVVVATSIAEEGIDLPVCELVVQLDAPDCVRALVQVRGRARYRDSRFVTFCRSAAQRLRLEELRRHEARMVEVVSDMIRQNRI